MNRSQPRPGPKPPIKPADITLRNFLTAQLPLTRRRFATGLFAVALSACSGPTQAQSDRPMAKQGNIVNISTPEFALAHFTNELVRYAALVKKAGVVPA